jgi:hypothetical protein
MTTDVTDSRTSDGQPLIDHLRETAMWGEIRRLARTHEGLRSELERVIMYYELIKNERKT